MVKWLGFGAFTARAWDGSLVRGTKIPQAVWNVRHIHSMSCLGEKLYPIWASENGPELPWLRCPDVLVHFCHCQTLQCHFCGIFWGANGGHNGGHLVWSTCLASWFGFVILCGCVGLASQSKCQFVKGRTTYVSRTYHWQGQRWEGADGPQSGPWSWAMTFPLPLPHPLAPNLTAL